MDEQGEFSALETAISEVIRQSNQDGVYSNSIADNGNAPVGIRKYQF